MHGIGGTAVLLGTTVLMGRLVRRDARAVPWFLALCCTLGAIPSALALRSDARHRWDCGAPRNHCSDGKVGPTRRACGALVSGVVLHLGRYSLCSGPQIGCTASVGLRCSSEPLF